MKIDPLHNEIMKKKEWSREEIVMLLEDKREEHLAVQIMTNGILCPPVLQSDVSTIPAEELCNWIFYHKQLLSCIYKLLLDNRISEVKVIPADTDDYLVDQRPQNRF